MSDDSIPPRSALITRPGRDYEVGYGKPPKEHRFRKGQSGNPRGRPKGSKNKLPALNEERLKKIVMEEAYRTITVRDGGQEVTVPIAQAVIRALAVNAAKGHHRSQRLFAELLAATESANKALSDEWLKTAIDYKNYWERELDRRQRFGITDLPPPIPHPDHVVIDMDTGLARVEGPMTKEQKAYFEDLQTERQHWQAQHERFESELAEETDPAACASIESALAKIRLLLGEFEEIMPRQVG